MVGEGGENMEKEFDSKMRIESNSSSSNVSNNNKHRPQRSKSFVFRAPQENFSIQDFELDKIYGVGSYSKVQSFSLLLSFIITPTRMNLHTFERTK